MNDGAPSPSSPVITGKRNWFSWLVQRFQRDPKNKKDLVEVIQDANERALIDSSTRDMIEGVLDVSTLKVRDIMIPRAQMVTIEQSLTVQEFLPIIIDSAHSRFPVINEDKDHIEGILLAKDLLKHGFNNKLSTIIAESLLRPAVIIPESKRIDKLLKEFRSNRYHMAVVVDEFGGVSGLVTIEDILERIVGEIVDEFDESGALKTIRQINKHTYSLSALTAVEEFNQYFNCNFTNEEADTIGGLLIHAVGHLPVKNETIQLAGFNFKVTSADNRRLIQLQLTTHNKRDAVNNSGRRLE